MLVGVLPAAQKYPTGHTVHRPLATTIAADMLAAPVMFDAAVPAPQYEPDGHSASDGAWCIASIDGGRREFTCAR